MSKKPSSAKLTAQEVPVDKILERDLLIYLPKNDRTIRVRQRGQFLEKNIYENYLRKGLGEFYFGELVAAPEGELLPPKSPEEDKHGPVDKKQDAAPYEEGKILTKDATNQAIASQEISKSILESSSGEKTSDPAKNDTQDKLAEEANTDNKKSLITHLVKQIKPQVGAKDEQEFSESNAAVSETLKEDSIITRIDEENPLEEQKFSSSHKKGKKNLLESRLDKEEDSILIKKSKGKSKDPTENRFSPNHEDEETTHIESSSDNEETSSLVKAQDEPQDLTEHRFSPDHENQETIRVVSKPKNTEEEKAILIKKSREKLENLRKLSKKMAEQKAKSFGALVEKEEKIRVTGKFSAMFPKKESDGASKNAKPKKGGFGKATSTKKESSFFAESQSIINDKMDRLKSDAEEFAYQIRSLEAAEATEEKVSDLVKRSGTLENIKKMKIARDLSQEMSTALTDGDIEKVEEIKESLQNLLDSREIPEELRFMVDESDEELFLVKGDNSNNKDPKAVALYLAREAEKTINEFESDMEKIEETLEEANSSFSIKSTTFQDNEESILSRGETEEVITRIKNTPEDPELPTIIKNQMEVLQTKQTILGKTHKIQEEMMKILSKPQNMQSEEEKEKIFILRSEMADLEKDLLTLSQAGDPRATKEWNNRIGEGKNITDDAPKDYVIASKKMSDLQKGVEDDVTVIKSSEKILHQKVKDLQLEGDRTAEASSYAAILALSLGYSNPKFIKEIQMIALLKDAKVSSPPPLPNYGQKLYSFLQNSLEEEPSDFTIRDGAQIVNLVHAYMNHPNYVSGRLKIDREKFSQLCDELLEKDDFDGALIARAKQYVNRGITNPTIAYVKELGYEARMALKNAK